MKSEVKLSKDTLFYIAWILMEIHICVANSDASGFTVSVISYISIILFLLKIIFTARYTLREILIMCIMILGGLYSSYLSGDMRVIWFVLVICAAKGIDFDKTVRYSLRTMLGCCIAFVLMYMFGIIESTTVFSIRGIRSSFGLGHPNMCAAYYSLIIAHVIYLYYDKLKKWHVLFLFLGSIGVYSITKSNTGLLVSVFALGITFIIKFLPYKKTNLKIIAIGISILIVLFSIMPIIYNNSMLILDNMLTGRLHQANFYYQKYGISLFGSDVSYDLNRWNTDNILDMGYAKLLINNGIFYYFLVVGGYLTCIKKSILKNRANLLLMFYIMLIYMISENVATYIFMNVSMVIFAKLLFNESNKKNNN